MTLAEKAGLAWLAEEHLRLPTDRGANPGLKLTSLVAGMVAGADSIDDLALLRHGGMNRLFTGIHAPSPWDRFCGRSPSDTCDNWTRRPPAC